VDNIEILRALSSLPLTALLMLVLIGGYMGWWIYGSIHRATVDELQKRVEMERARADRWEARALDKKDHE